MGKRNRYRDHVDPEYQRWGRRYPRFPGVAECVNLIRSGKTQGAWADIICFELAENTTTCLLELIEAFRNDAEGNVRRFVMMALEIARPRDAVPFLAEVLKAGDRRYVPCAEQTLREMDTPETRSILWRSAHPDSPKQITQEEDVLRD